MMSRSYNSRKGTYKRCSDPYCSICHRSGHKHMDTENLKRNFLKFDGILFKYKRKEKKKKKRYGSWLSNYHIREIENSKKSYRNWCWLKGKANEKGKYHSNYKYIFRNSSLR